MFNIIKNKKQKEKVKKQNTLAVQGLTCKAQATPFHTSDAHWVEFFKGNLSPDTLTNLKHVRVHYKVFSGFRIIIVVG